MAPTSVKRVVVGSCPVGAIGFALAAGVGLARAAVFARGTVFVGTFADGRAGDAGITGVFGREAARLPGMRPEVSRAARAAT